MDLAYWTWAGQCGHKTIPYSPTYSFMHSWVVLHIIIDILMEYCYWSLQDDKMVRFGISPFPVWQNYWLHSIVVVGFDTYTTIVEDTCTILSSARIAKDIILTYKLFVRAEMNVWHSVCHGIGWTNHVTSSSVTWFLKTITTDRCCTPRPAARGLWYSPATWSLVAVAHLL